MGRNLKNEGYWKMNENLNIRRLTTAVEITFGNGIMEHHDLKVAEAMEKMSEDEKSEPEMALA